MNIRLHANAATTPRVRREIQQSTETDVALAARYHVTIDTIRRWRKRDDVHDRSHTPHRLQTTLTPAQEAIAVELRRLLLLPLDDLLVVVRVFLNPDVSPSGLDRCLRSHLFVAIDRATRWVYLELRPEKMLRAGQGTLQGPPPPH